jgi:hypothetical protein
MERINSHRDLRVYHMALAVAREFLPLIRGLPAEEVNKAEADPAGTQVHLELAAAEGHMDADHAGEFIDTYERVPRQLASMSFNADQWTPGRRSPPPVRQSPTPPVR